MVCVFLSGVGRSRSYDDIPNGAHRSKFTRSCLPCSAIPHVSQNTLFLSLPCPSPLTSTSSTPHTHTLPPSLPRPPTHSHLLTPSLSPSVTPYSSLSPPFCLLTFHCTLTSPPPPPPPSAVRNMTVMDQTMVMFLSLKKSSKPRPSEE